MGTTSVMTDGMRAWMAGMMAFGALVSVLAIVVLTLLVIWLLLQPGRGSGQPG